MKDARLYLTQVVKINSPGRFSHFELPIDSFKVLSSMAPDVSVVVVNSRQLSSKPIEQRFMGKSLSSVGLLWRGDKRR